MQIHDFVLISKFLSQLEEQTHLERAIFNTFFSLGLCFAVLTERVKAASLVDVDLLVLISTLDKLIVDLHGLLVVSIMEGTVGNSEKGARFGVVGVLAIALEKAESRHEVALLQKVVGIWQPHFFLLLGLDLGGRSLIALNGGDWSGNHF